MPFVVIIESFDEAVVISGAESEYKTTQPFVITRSVTTVPNASWAIGVSER